MREVFTIIGRPHVVGDNCSARDRYAKEAKKLPWTHVHMADEPPIGNTQRELEDIIFAEVDIKWVHHPHIDDFFIIVRVANNNVHRMLVDNGSAIDILY